MSKDTDNRRILLHPFQISLEVFLAFISLILLGVLGEGLLLALVPVFVEPPLQFVTQMLSPDGVERAEATRGLDVTHQAHNNHGWCLNQGDSLTCLLLVQF